MLRAARAGAGISQRVLATRTGVAQPTIARIEAGRADPRIGTLLRLLRACGRDIALVEGAGRGVDRTQMRELLGLSPGERLELLRRDAEGLRRLEGARR